MKKTQRLPSIDILNQSYFALSYNLVGVVVKQLGTKKNYVLHVILLNLNYRCKFLKVKHLKHFFTSL